MKHTAASDECQNRGSTDGRVAGAAPISGYLFRQRRQRQEHHKSSEQATDERNHHAGFVEVMLQPIAVDDVSLGLGWLTFQSFIHLMARLAL